jgi:TolB-like protein
MNKVIKSTWFTRFSKFAKFAQFTVFTWFRQSKQGKPGKLREPCKQRKLSKLFVFSFLLVFVGACATNTSTQYVRQNVDYKNLQRIAVLPFESHTDDEYAGEKIRKTVITELLSRGVDVIEPGEVTRVLIDQKVKSLSTIRTADLQNVAKTLGVEALMMGSVEAYGISKGISVTYPEVSINVRLIEVSSGNIIWSVYQTSGGASFWTRHFGAEGISLSEAANKVVEEAIDTLY